MRFVRPDLTWRVLFATDGNSLCLQRLALAHGYRVTEVCNALQCSQRYLYQVFTRDIGLSPKEWMRRERMVVARRMLAGGRHPDFVAEKLGFGSKQNFRREFVLYHRVSPLQFQQECLAPTF